MAALCSLAHLVVQVSSLLLFCHASCTTAIECTQSACSHRDAELGACYLQIETIVPITKENVHIIEDTEETRVIEHNVVQIADGRDANVPSAGRDFHHDVKRLTQLQEERDSHRRHQKKQQEQQQDERHVKHQPQSPPEQWRRQQQQQQHSQRRHQWQHGNGDSLVQVDEWAHFKHLVDWFWHDLFASRSTVDRMDKVHNAADWTEWAVLVGSSLVLLCVEVFAFRGVQRSFWGNIAILGFWILMGFCYNCYYIARYGWGMGLEWTTGYILEWMLSMDNLFVFHLIFQVYKTPPQLQQKALFVGITGALLLKLLFFLLAGALIHLISTARFIFGLLLVYSGVEAFRAGDDDQDPATSRCVKLVKSILGTRLWEHYDLEGCSIFMRHPQSGRQCATLLFLVIILLELTDVIFAMDSVSAKVGQIHNLYTAYSSSVLAVFSLRAMFFVINDLVNIFNGLKYGICCILVFIGIELLVSEYVELPPITVCIVVTAVFVISILVPQVAKPRAATEKQEAD